VDHNPLRFSVREYDLATGRHKELFVIPPRTDPDGKPRGIGGEKFALSPDDTLLAEGHSDEVYVWDLAGGRVRHHLKGAVGWRMAFLPDGSRLATAGGPGVGPRLWDLKTGKEAAALAWDKPSTAGVGGLAVSPNGRWLAATENVHLLGTGTRLVVWDLTGPNPPRAITLPETTSSGGALVFGPDGRTLFVVAPGKPRSAVSQWDVAEGKRLAQWAGPYLEHFPAAAVSPDGGTLAVGSLTGVIHLYQTRTGKEVVRPTGHAAPVAAVEYLRAAVQTVGADGTAASWDPATGAQKGNLTLAAADRTGDELARVAMGGPWVLTRVENRAGLRTEPPFILALWDGATGERKHTWIVDGHTTAIGLGRDGRFAVAQLEGRGFRVWDTATGNEIADIFRPHRNWAARFTVLPDGKTLVVCDEVEADGFDLATGKRVFGWKLADHDVLGRPLPAEDQRPGLVRALAASPDGKTLAIQVGGEWFIDPARRPHNLVLVEARTGKVLRRVQTPDTPAEALVFSPNGKCLAGTWCVWEAATLGEAFRFPALLKVTAFGFSPDSRRVATGLADGTTLVWEVEGRK
jgi:WD40 repeat protein